MSNQADAEKIEAAYQTQLSIVTMLQHQASTYPSLENLEKLNAALEGWYTIVSTFGIYDQQGGD